MKFNISFFLIIVNFSLLNSQYIETINSNRPGSSHGAFSVGKNVLQIETGFKSSDFKNVNLKNSEILENKISYTIRYGLLLNKLEVFIDGSYNKNEISDLLKNDYPEALVIRTSPNNDLKKTKKYSIKNYLCIYLKILYISRFFSPFKIILESVRYHQHLYSPKPVF